MKWVDSIWATAYDIWDWFRKAAQNTKDWWMVGSFFSSICLSISDAFWSLLAPIGNFGDWADDIWARTQNILTSEGILGLIKSWFPWLESIGIWFQDWWRFVNLQIDAWWSGITDTVKGWITVATQGLSALIVAWSDFWNITWPEWMTKFSGIATAWDTFWTVTYPNLVDVSWAWSWWGDRFKEVGALLDSKFKEWFPFYDEMVLFFKNPFDFIKTHVFEPIIDDFNKGFERGMSGEEKK